MMAEGSGTRIKQEIDTTSCCSPSPSTGNNNNNTAQSFMYNNTQSNVSCTI